MIVLAASLAIAQADAAPAAAQPSTAAPAPICTDRPTKANVACTVPKGDVQVEADVVNWTRFDAAGVRTDVVLYTNPTVKYGLDGSTDLELNIAPYETARTRAGSVATTVGGVGDLYLRLKRRLPGTGGVQASLIPYVKAPTARAGLGDGAWEGGVIAPVLFTLPLGVTLDLAPEVDLLADADRRGRHAQLIGLVNLYRSWGEATVYAELWTAQNYDPAGAVRQHSADAAVAYLVTPVLQLDIGANFGLDRRTPGSQLYLGVSRRF